MAPFWSLLEPNFFARITIHAFTSVQPCNHTLRFFDIREKLRIKLSPKEKIDKPISVKRTFDIRRAALRAKSPGLYT
jgi:hypothetical protein